MGPGNGQWVPHDVRDRVVDFVRGFSEKTELRVDRVVGWVAEWPAGRFAIGSSVTERPMSTMERYREITGSILGSVRRS